MTTLARSIITDGRGGFLRDEVELDPPRDGEVLVRIEAAGVCHTDHDSMSWRARMTTERMVMGHEGAGVVEACGPRVDHVRPGDSVLLNWAIPCGRCFQCERGAENICENRPTVPAERRRHGGQAIEASFGLGTMSTHAIVPDRAVVPIGEGLPFPAAAILGCGVMTGFGSVVNAAKVEAGASVVVLGTGGVGLSVIRGGAPRGLPCLLRVRAPRGRAADGVTDVRLARQGDRLADHTDGWFAGSVKWGAEPVRMGVRMRPAQPGPHDRGHGLRMNGTADRHAPHDVRHPQPLGAGGK